MKKLVTIGVPIYKRLNYLPNILRVIRAQDYPNIELIVSDNGLNGSRIGDIIDNYYQKPYRFRQNPSTVTISQHYNQLVEAASGEYFVLLADDDEISHSYVSELVQLLERHPTAKVAISRQEVLDEPGNMIRQSRDNLPEVVLGPQFIRAVWDTRKFGFECFATFLARTADIERCGAYPDFTLGTHNDDALLIKLCLNGAVVMSNACTFRWRLYQSSHGWSISLASLLASSREFLEFLNSDPRILAFAESNPGEWDELRKILITLGWKTYYLRWKEIYKPRLPRFEWMKAGFGMPFLREYYIAVAHTLLSEAKALAVAPLKRLFPNAYRKYVTIKYGQLPTLKP